jgi:hypothetical protein
MNQVLVLNCCACDDNANAQACCSIALIKRLQQNDAKPLVSKVGRLVVPLGDGNFSPYVPQSLSPRLVGDSGGCLPAALPYVVPMESQPLPTIGDPIQNLLDGDCFIRVLQLLFALGALRLRAVHGIDRFFVDVR